MADQDGRVEITSEQFFASLDPRLGAEVRSVIDDLIEWSHEDELVEYFSTGERGPAFTPQIQRPAKSNNLLLVQSDGWIVLPIRWIANRPPFSDPEKRQQVINRIKDIPGSVITEKGNEGFPKFPASTLSSPEQFSDFIETLDWIIGEIKDADSATGSVERSIWIYGNPDKTNLGFPMPGDLTKYLKGEIFSQEGGRYRYTQGKNADVIVLSRDGLAFGHLEVKEKVKPNDADRAAYPRVRFVYVVRSSHLYKHPVPLGSMSITVRQYGHRLTESEFQELLEKAEGVQEYRNIPPIPEEIQSPTKYFEGAITTITVNSYERNSDARQACLQHHGYSCAVCGFSMEDLYGELGKTVIHVHHLRELSKIGMEYEVDPIHDLRPVCPNCHSILHTESPAMPIETLQKLLSERKPVQWPAQNAPTEG